MTQGQILKVPEVAEYLRCSKITVYRHAEKGDLPGHHFGGQWRFFMDEINRWLREKREAERKFKRRRHHQILAPIKLDKDFT